MENVGGLVELLPLPLPYDEPRVGYSAREMQSYAAACVEAALSAHGENASVLQPIQMPSEGEIIDAANAAFMDQKDTRQDNDLFYIRTVKSLFLQRIDTFGQPVDYSPALHSVLSYIAYGECDEEGLHPGLFATVKEKIDKLRSKPVVDEAMAQKFWDGYEQYFVDLSADELFDGKDRKIEAAMSALTAALTGADHE